MLCGKEAPLNQPHPAQRRALALFAVTALGMASLARDGWRSQPGPDELAESTVEQAAARTAGPGLRPSSTPVPGPAPETPADARAELYADLRETTATDTWVPHQLLVSTESPEDLDRIAGDWNALLVRSEASPTRGVLRLPDNTSIDAASRAISRDAGVQSVGRHAIVRGALFGLRKPAAQVHTGMQWHLEAAGFGSPSTHDGANVTVAVIDSGLKSTTLLGLEAASGNGTTTLQHVSTDDRWDYVDGDRTLNDEHWHGTHISSLIASSRLVAGGAPGASLAIYRVLDRENRGLEMAFVDAVERATDRGVDVMNLSLSFGAAYVPSAALTDALAHAAEAGVVMVAAAGNNGDYGATWPAASRHVLAVAATCGTEASGRLLAPYSNRGSDIAIAAPGGCMDRDDTGDLAADGLMAESTLQLLGGVSGLFWAEGTSQAAALVSAAAARLLSQGVPPEAVGPLLRSSGPLLDPSTDLTSLDVAVAEALTDMELVAPSEVYVAMMPWMAATADGLEPRVTVLGVDTDGEPVDGLPVYGHFAGETSGSFSCVLRAGRCTAAGPPSAAGADEPVQWTVVLGKAGVGADAQTPRGASLVSDALLEGLDLVAQAENPGPVGVFIQPGTLPSAVAGISFVSLESARVGAPTATMFTPSWMASTGATLSAETGGSGLATSPMGYRQYDSPQKMDRQPRTMDGSSNDSSPVADWMAAWADPDACLTGDRCPVSMWADTPAHADPALSAVMTGDYAVVTLLSESADGALGLPLHNAVPLLYLAF